MLSVQQTLTCTSVTEQKDHVKFITTLQQHDHISNFIQAKGIFL